MVKYQARHPGKDSRFWTNPSTLIGVLAIAGLVSVWFVRHRSQMNSGRNVENNRGPARVTGNNRKADSNAAAVQAPPPPSAASAVEMPPPPPPPTTASVNGVAPRDARLAGAAANANGADQFKGARAAGAEKFDDSARLASGELSDLDSGPGQMTTPIRFTFVEAPIGLAEQLVSEQNKSNGKGLSKETMNRLWNLVRKTPAMELHSIVYGFGSQRPHIKKSLMGSEDSFGGSAEADDDVRVVLDAQIQTRQPAGSGRNDSVSGSFRLTNHFKLEESGAIHTKEKEFSSSFSFNKNSAWIYGLELPHGEIDPQLAQSGLFKVYSSPAFQKKQSKVLLVLEIDHSLAN